MTENSLPVSWKVGVRYPTLKSEGYQYPSYPVNYAYGHRFRYTSYEVQYTVHLKLYHNLLMSCLCHLVFCYRYLYCIGCKCYFGNWYVSLFISYVKLYMVNSAFVIKCSPLPCSCEFEWFSSRLLCYVLCIYIIYLLTYLWIFTFHNKCEMCSRGSLLSTTEIWEDKMH